MEAPPLASGGQAKQQCNITINQKFSLKVPLECGKIKQCWKERNFRVARHCFSALPCDVVRHGVEPKKPNWVGLMCDANGMWVCQFIVFVWSMLFSIQATTSLVLLASNLHRCDTVWAPNHCNDMGKFFFITSLLVCLIFLVQDWNVHKCMRISDCTSKNVMHFWCQFWRFWAVLMPVLTVHTWDDAKHGLNKSTSNYCWINSTQYGTHCTLSKQ